jgi:hypothetical protein
MPDESICVGVEGRNQNSPATFGSRAVAGSQARGSNLVVVAARNSGRYDVRLIKVGLVEIQTRVNHLLANPDPAGRLGIAIAR